MLLLLFAAHQGEEFVLILPAIMLVGAFIILKWANQPGSDDDEESHASTEDESEEEEKEPELIGHEGLR
jgi:hypothetical protein